MNHKNKVKKYYFSRRPAVSFPEKIGLKINFSLDPYPTQKNLEFFLFLWKAQKMKTLIETYRLVFSKTICSVRTKLWKN